MKRGWKKLYKTLQACQSGNSGNAWPSPSKIILSICRKLSYLYACNKSTSSLTFFLWYCKEIENLLFWVLLECPTTPKLIVSIWRNLWCSFHFPWHIANMLQIWYSGYFGQAWLHTPKMILAPCRKLSHFYLQAKEPLHFPCFSRDITKICKLPILGTLGMSGCARPRW